MPKTPQRWSNACNVSLWSGQKDCANQKNAAPAGKIKTHGAISSASRVSQSTSAKIACANPLSIRRIKGSCSVWKSRLETVSIRKTWWYTASLNQNACATTVLKSADVWCSLMSPTSIATPKLFSAFIILPCPKHYHTTYLIQTH